MSEIQITLPTQKQKATVIEPKKMMIVAHPKVGKTSALVQLPNSLVIDLESSASYFDSSYIDVKKVASDNNIGLSKALLEVRKSIVSKNTEKGSPFYDFIIIDTTTVLEDIAKQIGLQQYKKSPVGKNFTGTDVLTLPNGGGYLWLRNAFKALYDAFIDLSGKCTILVGHIKDASINKDGEDISAMDVNLTGKLKTLVCSDMDATGFMYRSKEGNQNILSFQTKPNDLITGSRLNYLSNENFVISEMINGKLKTNWDLIFPSLKQ